MSHREGSVEKGFRALGLFFVFAAILFILFIAATTPLAGFN